VLHAYYLAPGIGFLVLAERLRGRPIVTKVIPGALVLLVFPWHPPRVLWWTVFYVLAAVLVSEPLRELGRHAIQNAKRSAAHRTAVPVGSGG
jgi:hypothetical protein